MQIEVKLLSEEGQHLKHAIQMSLQVIPASSYRGHSFLMSFDQVTYINMHILCMLARATPLTVPKGSAGRLNCQSLQEASLKADSAEADVPKLAAKVVELAQTLQTEEQVHLLT